MYVNDRLIKTKLDKGIVEELRRIDLPIKFRAYCIKILDELIIWKNGILEYNPVKKLIKRLKSKVCSTHGTIHFLLNILRQKNLILFFQSEYKNQYGKFDYSAQIEQNFHNQEWYTFSEDDEEFEYLKRTSAKKENNRINRQNDAGIGLLENDLEKIKDTHPNVYQIMKDRLDGIYVRTPTKKGICGREYSIFTSMKKDIRECLVNLNTGEELESIDITACQISLALGLIKNTFIKNASPELLQEIDSLENIQSTISFHTYFQNLLQQKNVNVSRNCIKPLVFKMLFGNFALHDLNVFNKDLKEEFEENGFDIEHIWKTFIFEFRSIFPNVYRCLNYLSKKAEKNSTTLAAILQKKESEIMTAIKTEAKKQIPNLNFFTVFDSIYFPKEFYNKMKRVFKKIQNKFSKKGYSFIVKFNSKDQKITPTNNEESNYVSFPKTLKKIKFILDSILNGIPEKNIRLNFS
jgi:hypothetical protein